MVEPAAPPPAFAPEPESPRERDRDRLERDEPRRAAATPARTWDEEPASFGRGLGDRETRPVAPDEPRGRLPRPVDPFEADLPPSRTQRPQPARPRPPEPEPDDVSWSAPDLDGPVAEPEPPSAPAGRGRGRGRGRSSRPASAEPEARRPEPSSEAPEPEPASFEPDEVVAEERPEAAPRRRGGRAAIRSRGGDREPAAERPRPPVVAQTPAPEPGPEPEPRPRSRVREPEPPRERPPIVEAPRERLPAVEAPRERPPIVESPRERPPIVESPRERPPAAEAPRERGRSHARAGEPGYVPRRERARPVEGPDDEDLAGPTGWSDLEPAAEEEGRDLEGGARDEGDESDDSSREGTRRRRRRRGRRRDRPEAGSVHEASAEEARDEDDDEPFESPAALDRDRDEDEDEGRGAPGLESVALEDDEFDFGDEIDEIDDEAIEPGGRPAASAFEPEDQIDPELEEEIRREIEEIAELEREMGLRGPIEARPRRGDGGPSAAPAGGRPARGRGLSKPPIQEIFRRGDEVLIQVIKESIGTKGPTLSTYISIPGRYLVLMPGLNRVGVSRKIADESQRRKLREIMNELNPPKGLGFIVRTAGLDRTKRELARDLAYLLRLWKVILRRIKKARAPAPIYQESDMITRTIRDIFNAEIDTIWIDERSAFDRAQEFLRVVMPRFVNRLKFYDDKVPLFHKYKIEDEIAKIQRRQVPLPEGGSIVIDQTEALVAIDVNSGNFRVENDPERTAYEMNLRAAKEIARQLRLRDLGGVIVNDFIDMRDERNRRGVEKALRDAIKRDRARTKVLRMSAFGLVEMTRQRIRPSLRRSVYEDCAHCTGAGVVKTAESMAIDVMRLLALAANREDIRRVNVSVCAAVSTYLNNRKRPELSRLEAEAGMTIHIRPEEAAPGEHLQIDCYDAQNNEVRLLPAAPMPPRRGR